MKEDINDEKKDKKGKEGQTQFRLVLTKESMEALDGLVSMVNDGFAAGYVSRSEFAGYLFKNASRFLSKSEIARIRAAFFDERRALDHLIRESESTGKLPEEIRKILKNQFQSSLGKP
jgi:hypothetical protein